MTNNRKPKIYAFDIEATNLAADIGYVLCVVIKDVDQGAYGRGQWIYRIDKTAEWKKEKWNDRGVVAAALKKLAEADLIVAHYGGRFDVPYLRTRALAHDLGDFPPVPLIDTWRVLKYQFKLHNNRLQTLIDFTGGNDKTKLKLPIWTRASAGDRKAIDYIVDHCIVDVNELVKGYKKIRYAVKDHPNVALLSKEVPKHAPECPACGSSHMQRRGWIIARTRRRARYQCQSCGHWAKGPSEKVMGVDVS